MLLLLCGWNGGDGHVTTGQSAFRSKSLGSYAGRWVPEHGGGAGGVKGDSGSVGGGLLHCHLWDPGLETKTMPQVRSQ